MAAAERALPACGNPGAHGLTEILYAFASSDGQQRLGLRGPERRTPSTNSDPRCRHADRAVRDHRPGPGNRRLDGRQAARRTPPLGTFPTTGPIWVALLIGVIVIGSGALTFFPALSLGPIVEQLKMAAGQVF